MYTWHQKNVMDIEYPFVMNCRQHSIAFPEHWHEEIEVIYLQNGIAVAQINGKQYDVADGDIIFVSSRETHSYLSNNEKVNALVLGIGTSYFGEHHDMIASSRFLSAVLHKPQRDGRAGEDGVYEEFERVFLSIIAHMDEYEAGRDLFIRARILDIAWIMISRMTFEPINHKQKVKQLNSNERLNDVFKFVSSNYQNPIKLETVSKLCNFSPYYFARFFKESVGMPFCKYLNEYRIKQARVHLLETEYPITDISFMVGFQSIKTFNRAFKSSMGVSPSDYRKRTGL